MTERRATYRVQLNAGFDFDAVTEVVPYLAELGVTHLYSSPYLQAAAGSTHGYDVVDPTRISEDLGGPAAFSRLCAAVGAAGMTQLLDIVPNHMSVEDRRNGWWWDVLADGRRSPYAHFFDINWESDQPDLHERVLVPILGDHIGRVLEAGELLVDRDGGELVVRYHDHTVPLSVDAVATVAGAAAAIDGVEALATLVAEVNRLDAAEPPRPRYERRRHLHTVLRDLCAGEPAAARAIDNQLSGLNHDPVALDALLRTQHYRLARWTTAASAINYRRFFDINTLVALRVDDPEVFAEGHRLVSRLLREGTLDGVRVDHVDGLRDPATYLRRLRELAGPDRWLLVEKILQSGEGLPAEWPIDGTTGYDFCIDVSGLFVDPAGEEPMTALHGALTGAETDFRVVEHTAKREVARTILQSDVERLVDLLSAVCSRHPEHRDHTRDELRDAVVETLVGMPVYRGYLTPATVEASGPDELAVRRAVDGARAAAPELDPELLELIGSLLLNRASHERGWIVVDPVGEAPDQEFVMRFQQVSTVVMAKGVEDTAFYRYNRLVSLNEVGGDPGRWGTSVDLFHEANMVGQSRYPQRLLATSTHDTKRGEDVRARISLLSEMAGPWTDAVSRWSEHNQRHRRDQLPDRATEYLYYQTLVGAHPISAERAGAYMEKATREAKLRTSWVNPDPAFDEALSTFVTRTLSDPEFVRDLDAFVSHLVRPGRVTSLAMALLKLTSPGVPDLYQGSELWNLSLVDPDNRRPVDYAERRRLLRLAGERDAAAIWTDEADCGLPKLLLTQRALELRGRRPAPFGAGQAGAYKPLAGWGSHAERLVAFSRGAEPEVVVVAPRLALGLEGGWADTTVRLPDGDWRDVITEAELSGGSVPLSELTRAFPVVLLERR
ncbi:MAG: malto-oligosyltrehalose synthase [Candidatus Dormibacteria bacterium]